MVGPPDTSKGTLLGPKTPGWEQWAYSTLFASEKLSPIMISWGERQQLWFILMRKIHLTFRLQFPTSGK